MSDTYGNAGSPWADLENTSDLGGAATRAVTGYSELGGIFEPCRKCGGTGHVRWGVCFACQGKGGKTFKTDATTRANNRAASANRKANKVESNWLDFVASHAELARWIEAKSPTFAFAASMRDAIRKFGGLTNNQLSACERLARADRDTERQARIESAPMVNVAPLVDYFARQGRRPGAGYRLRLDTFIFSPAGSSSRNPGAIYVKEGETYLGKIHEGKFVASRECASDQSARILAACANPLNAARAYGKRFGVCSVCGRTLTDPTSIANGIGPICEAGF